jgi:hypothetical protein
LYYLEMLLHKSRLLLVMFLSVLLCFSLILSAKAETTMYDETYGGISRDRAFSLVIASDGGYVLAGASNSFGVDGMNGWLVKTDANGIVEWNMTYGGAGDDVISSVVIESDGGYALGGKSNCDAGFWIDKQALDVFVLSDGDAWLIKTDSSGNMEWNKTYGGTGGGGVFSLVETTDGGYALAGCTHSANSSFYGDAWLVKTDSSGNREWNKTYGGPYLDGFFSLIVASDGGYAIAGYTNPSSASDMNFWLVKTDEFGNMEWNMTYEGAGWDEAYSLVETSDGGYAIAGATGTFGPPGGDFWLMKTDGVGNVQWNQTYGGAGEDFANSLVETSDGGFAIAGYMYVTFSLGSNGDDDVWLLKTDENGVVPEASWVVLPLLVIATVSIFVSKKKLLHKQYRKRR